MRGSIAVGVPVFSRTDALRQLLESVPDYVETVYVADNGRAEERTDLYARTWQFDLDILDLDYDVGIGACRSAIADAVTEDYLWVGDCDMVFVRGDDLRRLREVLEANPQLGGISGWLIEGGTIRSGARSLVQEGSHLIKEVSEPPTLEGDTTPFARFDFIPQCGLFRTAAFDTYSWDADVQSTEHADFFYGHVQADEWDFASTPAVLVEHNRWIDTEYRESKRGSNHVDEDILAEKWGIEEIQPGSSIDWAGYRDRSVREEAFDVLRSVAPPAVWIPTKRFAKWVIQ